MVAEYIAGIKTAIELAKAVKVATDSLDNAQVKLQMAELISALADAKLEAAENAERIAKLEAKIHARDTLNYEQGLYYRVLDSENKDGPFCPTCHDSEMKEIRLRPVRGDGYNWHCNVCRFVF